MVDDRVRKNLGYVEVSKHITNEIIDKVRKAEKNENNRKNIAMFTPNTQKKYGVVEKEKNER